MVENAADTIDDLCQSVQEELGVNMEIFQGKNGLVLADIERESGPPGAGKEALRRLCNYADLIGQPIYLTVLDYSQKLVSIYEAFGFTLVEPQADGEMAMIRQPH